MRIIVSGAGIAGLTFAYCLNRAGVECVVVEKSASLRGEGYMIDFFGSGYDAAERLGLLSDLEQIHYPIDRLRFLKPSAQQKYSVPYRSVRQLFDGRHFNFLRSDLEQVLYSTVRSRVEIRFGTEIESVEQNASGVLVRLSDGGALAGDLLVGADGIHSEIRRLCFGPESEYSRYLGCDTAAYIIEQPPAKLLEPADAFSMLTVSGRQVSAYPIRGGKVATFFVHRTQGPSCEWHGEAAVEELRTRYRDMGWIVPELLSYADPRTLYFDSVSQIVMPRWVKGRVVLIGDAAHCVSLVAGQGASLAMAGAYILAEEIGRTPRDLGLAAMRYEERLRPSVESKQAAGRKMVDWFLPDNAIRLWVRDTVMRLSALPVARALVKRAVAPESVFLHE